MCAYTMGMTTTRQETTTTASTDLLGAVLNQHRLVAKTLCGARSIPLVHHHAGESDKRPGPLRLLRCTNVAGHDGLHKDAICCYSFQTFEDWQVTDRTPPSTFDACSCGTMWPCPTISALQEASPKVGA